MLIFPIFLRLESVENRLVKRLLLVVFHVGAERRRTQYVERTFLRVHEEIEGLAADFLGQVVAQDITVLDKGRQKAFENLEIERKVEKLSMIFPLSLQTSGNQSMISVHEAVEEIPLLEALW